MTLTPLKIAIVSDLHIGEHAREFDMQPDGKPPYPDYPGYLKYFEQVVRQNALHADILVVSGDVTHQAQPSQFMHASKVIKDLAAILEVPDGQTIVVPGNHDLNWDIANLATSSKEPFWLDFCFAPFRNGSQQAGCDDAMVAALLEPPHFFVHSHTSADIWCFNSAAYDLPGQKPHRGEIKEAHRTQLQAQLSARYNSVEKERYRIFVTHHHPKPQPDLYRDIPDFSGMVNGESLLDLLIEHRFDLVIHGHKHRPWCRPFLDSGKDPIVVWCSGSFAQTLGAAYYGSIGNLWHLAEVQGVNDAGHCYGVVQSWAFAPAQGWVPSRPAHHGIDHITPFGYLADRATILDLTRVELAATLQQKPTIRWDEIKGRHSVLQFQPGPVVWRILDELSPELGFRNHGERDSLDQLLIVREEVA